MANNFSGHLATFSTQYSSLFPNVGLRFTFLQRLVVLLILESCVTPCSHLQSSPLGKSWMIHFSQLPDLQASTPRIRSVRLQKNSTRRHAWEAGKISTTSHERNLPRWKSIYLFKLNIYQVISRLSRNL